MHWPGQEENEFEFAGLGEHGLPDWRSMRTKESEEAWENDDPGDEDDDGDDHDSGEFTSDELDAEFGDDASDDEGEQEEEEAEEEEEPGAEEEDS